MTDRCSDWNPVTETLKAACEARGHGFQRITRNADEEHYDADLAGLMGFGDVSGAKNSTQKTWLQDAADAGARFVVNCRVERARSSRTGAPPASRARTSTGRAAPRA